jgi:hypothetical protein
VGETTPRRAGRWPRGRYVDGYLAGEDRPSTVVEPKPRATGLTLDEIVTDYLDYLHHEAFFVVSTTFEVTAYRTLWFGLQYDSETVEKGETVGTVRSRPYAGTTASRSTTATCRGSSRPSKTSAAT